MDGLGLLEAITGYGKSKPVPIIFLSAVNTEKRFITKGVPSGGAIDYPEAFDPWYIAEVKTFVRLQNGLQNWKRSTKHGKSEWKRAEKLQQSVGIKDL